MVFDLSKIREKFGKEITEIDLHDIITALSWRSERYGELENEQVTVRVNKTMKAKLLRYQDFLIKIEDKKITESAIIKDLLERGLLSAMKDIRNAVSDAEKEKDWWKDWFGDDK